MTSPVVFRRAARREFDEAALWYEERRAGLGSQFISEINHAIKLVVENPPLSHHAPRDSMCSSATLSIFGLFSSGGTTHRRAGGVSCAPRSKSVAQPPIKRMRGMLDVSDQLGL